MLSHIWFWWIRFHGLTRQLKPWKMVFIQEYQSSLTTTKLLTLCCSACSLRTSMFPDTGCCWSRRPLVSDNQSRMLWHLAVSSWPSELALTTADLLAPKRSKAIHVNKSSLVYLMDKTTFSPTCLTSVHKQNLPICFSASVSCFSRLAIFCLSSILVLGSFVSSHNFLWRSFVFCAKSFWLVSSDSSA